MYLVGDEVLGRAELGYSTGVHDEDVVAVEDWADDARVRSLRGGG